MIPHMDKAYRGGEDAFYISDSLLVVADGVGGWADSGVNPGLYSR
jgi:protein phosphatase PTC7